MLTFELDQTVKNLKVIELGKEAGYKKPDVIRASLFFYLLEENSFLISSTSTFLRTG